MLISSLEECVCVTELCRSGGRCRAPFDGIQVNRLDCYLWKQVVVSFVSLNFLDATSAKRLWLFCSVHFGSS